MNTSEKESLLAQLKTAMELDTTLPLKAGATNLVFGEGSPNSPVLFIGEGPGYWEDTKARPFVGNAGKLLDQLISLLDFKREEVFITNVVHHRPPGNRDPLPHELLAYAKYLDRMIKIIAPKLIVTLGRFSMGKFLKDKKISQVHGKVFKGSFHGMRIAVVPMYHPSAALRSSEVKTQTLQDFKELKGIITSLINN